MIQTGKRLLVVSRQFLSRKKWHLLDPAQLGNAIQIRRSPEATWSEIAVPAWHSSWFCGGTGVAERKIEANLEILMKISIINCRCSRMVWESWSKLRVNVGEGKGLWRKKRMKSTDKRFRETRCKLLRQVKVSLS